MILKSFLFYGLMQSVRENMFNNDDEHVKFTKEIIQIIKDNRVIDWIEKDDIKREMRKRIRRKLRQKGCPSEKVEPLIIEIMSLASKHFRDY